MATRAFCAMHLKSEDVSGRYRSLWNLEVHFNLIHQFFNQVFLPALFFNLQYTTDNVWSTCCPVIFPNFWIYWIWNYFLKHKSHTYIRFLKQIRSHGHGWSCREQSAVTTSSSFEKLNIRNLCPKQYFQRVGSNRENLRARHFEKAL